MILQEIATQRQYEIAGEIAKGYSEDEIADRLCIAKETVHAHAYNLRKKINARCAVDIARKFILDHPEPRKFFMTMVFLIMQTTMIFCGSQQELRKPARVRTSARTTRLIRNQ